MPHTCLVSRSRPLPDRILIGIVRAVGDRAARVLSSLEGEVPQPPPVEHVRAARRAAVDTADHELDRRLAGIEDYLAARADAEPDSLLPSRRDRARYDARLEDIRQSLLAKTPRPGNDESD